MFVVLDDVGYGQLSCFGGLVETPNIDRVAASGLRYANMHTTALCSPTRASILTGRNHHSSGVACIMELATGYPGYDGRMPFENGMLPEMLVPAGYNTFCLGKWHLSPAEENTPAGPFHRWPLGRGFERFYGFLGGETNQWYPDLTLDNGPTRQPKGPEDGYHLSEDLADQAIKMVLDAHVNAPEKPFFMYYAPGAAHAPHHVRKEWADRYKGKFDGGWDAYRETVFANQQRIGLLPADAKLSPRDPDVPEWSTLSADERRLYARMMEVFAGFVSHADHHFGRILDTLEQIGELENTLIMVISDNGASAEGGVTGSFNEMRFFNQVPESFEDNLAHIDDLGGPSSYNHYAWGWAWAGDTPFRRWKRETYRGGSTDPFILSWPAGMAGARRGPHAVRARDRHGPDGARRARPRSRRRRSAAWPRPPLEGVSFAHTFDDAQAPREARHAVLRDVRPPLDLPRRLARGVPVAGAELHRGGQARAQLRHADHARDPGGARPQRLGALPHGRRPDRVARRRRRAPRRPARADRALVGGGGALQGAAARRVGAAAARDRAPADLQAARAASSTTRAARSCRPSPRR